VKLSHCLENKRKLQSISMDTYSLLDLETKSARISAVLDLRPNLANVWRQMIAFSEAGANLALEDISVSESDILGSLLGDAIPFADPQAVAISSAVHKAILSPGHILSDPGLVFDRAHRAGRISSLVDFGQGGRASYPKTDQDDGWKEAREFFVTGVPKILRAKGAISLKSLSVAALLADISPERHPIAERIIFMASEGCLRQDLMLKDPIVTPSYRDLPSSAYAHWSFLPAISLSQGVFRAWSPGTPRGQGEVIKRLSSTLKREAGRIGYIHDWMRRSERDFVGQNKRSRRTGLVKLAFASPILDAKSVSRALDCTERAARTLLSDAADQDILRPLTTRSTYRIWGVPALHELMRERSSTTNLRKNSTFQSELTKRDQIRETSRKAPISDQKELDSRLDQIISELDDIITASDRLLDKTRMRKMPIL
jgi:hypothetical protein